ncbi:hypothetical protein HY992_00620 [Candidatus Micrarchaeota archaeon]|nr:hypothetical protein [Candidatus Micrarchaeota archaeon]
MKKFFVLLLAASLLLFGCAQTQEQPQAGESNKTLNETPKTLKETTLAEKTKQKLAALPPELPDLYRSKETSIDLGTDILENPFPDKPNLGSESNNS